MDGYTEFMIGFIILLGSIIPTVILTLQDKLRFSYAIFPFITGFLIFIVLAYIASVEIDKENKALDLKQHEKINQLSCAKLGIYLVENSTDNTSDIYKYALAKYLVCTHGGST